MNEYTTMRECLMRDIHDLEDQRDFAMSEMERRGCERDKARDTVLRLRKQRAIARNFGEQMERERDEAREALDRIARPVWWMQEDQKRKTGSINGISGGMALALSEDAEYLKGIARSALRGEAK